MNNTHIICAGRYGENVVQLDITVTIGTGVSAVALTNHEINSTISQDIAARNLVDLADAGINTALNANGLPAVNEIVAGTDSDNLAKPLGPAESGMGNLVADSLRYMVGGAVPAIGAVANGVVRNGFEQGQGISFADLYSVLPLGMTLDPTQQNIPGYPLMLVYLTGQEVSSMCQFISYSIAAGDEDFIASLPALQGAYSSAALSASDLSTYLTSGSPGDLMAYNGYVLPASGTSPADEAIAAFNAVGTGDSAACQAAAQVYSAAAAQAAQAAALCQGLQQILPMIAPDYFLNTSGIQFSHGGAGGLYQVTDVNLYGQNDFSCTGAAADIDTGALYPVVIDLYALLIMQNDSFSQMLTALGIPIVLKDSTGTAVNNATLLNVRLDRDNDSSNGIQEVKEWMAFLQFLIGGEFPGNIVSDLDYGTNALGRISSAP